MAAAFQRLSMLQLGLLQCHPSLVSSQMQAMVALAAFLSNGNLIHIIINNYEMEALPLML